MIIFAGGFAREYKIGVNAIHFSGLACQKVKDIKNVIQLMVFEELDA